MLLNPEYNECHVKTMSDDSINYFIEFAAYYNQYGNFSMLGSKEWAKPEPVEEEINIHKTSWCSPFKGSCKCPFGSDVHFGAKDSNG